MPKCPQCGKSENVHSDELHIKWIHICYDCGKQWFTEKPREAWLSRDKPNPQDVEYYKWQKQWLEEKRQKS